MKKLEDMMNRMTERDAAFRVLGASQGAITTGIFTACGFGVDMMLRAIGVKPWVSRLVGTAIPAAWIGYCWRYAWEVAEIMDADRYDEWFCSTSDKCKDSTEEKKEA